MVVGHVQDHVARLVQPAGVVRVQLARRPSRSSVQASQTTGGRRGSTPRPDTVQSSRSSTAQDGTASRQPDQQRVADHRGGAEKPGTRRDRSVIGGVDRRVDWLGLGRRRGRTSHGMIASSRVVLNTTGSAMSVRGVATWVSLRTSTGLRLRRGQPERHVPARGGGRAELDPDQLEELDVVQVRDPVEPVDQLVDHLGNGLDQRHAGVGDVVVGPGRAALLDQPLGVVDEILEVPVVEVGCGQHVRSPSGENRPVGLGGVRREAGAGSPAGSAPVGSSLLGMT